MTFDVPASSNDRRVKPPSSEVVWSYDGGPVLEVWRESRRQGGFMHWITAQANARGVVVIPVQNSTYLLQRQVRRATERPHLQFPRGFGELAESGPSDTHRDAARELFEETGLTASMVRTLGTIYLDPGLLSNPVSVVIAQVEIPDDLVELGEQLGEEAIGEYVTATLADLSRLIRDGELDDGPTLAAISLLRAQLDTDQAATRTRLAQG